MPRYEWTPEEEAVVFHVMERVVVDQKKTTREAFIEAAAQPELVKHNRTDGGVKYHWNSKLRKQATGRLGEWVKKNAIYSGKNYKSLPTKVKQSSRRAQILQLLNMASDELDTIDEKQEAAIEQVRMLGRRKLELNKNMRNLVKELEEITAASASDSEIDPRTLLDPIQDSKEEEDEATA